MTDEHEKELRNFLKNPKFFENKEKSLTSHLNFQPISDLTLDDYDLEWQYVNHSILIIGWGYDEKTKTKYWICRNSYGTNYGEENGHFRVRRGKNDFGIESHAFSLIPKLLLQTNQLNR